MANERVSQLQDLFASDIQSNDLFLVTDISQRESKRLEVGQLLLFIESSGSFFAYHATNADTASYIHPSAIDGIVATALNASHSVSSSYADKSISASFSDRTVSSSYSSFCVTTLTEAETASFLKYTGTPNGTSSYSIKSLTSDSATVAQNLLYTGIPNGTASFAISASRVVTASYAISASNTTSASNAFSSSFASTAYYSIFAGTSSVSTMTDSASVAQTASFVPSAIYGPKFITPIIIASSTSAVGWTKYNCPTQYIPIGTRVIIVDAYSISNGTNNAGFVEIAATSAATASAYYIVTAYKTAGGGDSCAFGGQACGPCSSSNANSSSFYYTFTQPAASATTLRLIGYY